MTIRCGNPTCTATLACANSVPVAVRMRQERWRIQQQPGDDEERAFCRRCAA